MKNSIAISLIVIVGIFGFVSGYSIGFKNGSNQTTVSTNQPVANSSTTESKPAATGGYGAPAAATEKSASSSSAAPAAKTEAPAPAAPGYGK